MTDNLKVFTSLALGASLGMIAAKIAPMTKGSIAAAVATGCVIGVIVAAIGAVLVLSGIWTTRRVARGVSWVCAARAERDDHDDELFTTFAAEVEQERGAAMTITQSPATGRRRSR
jgi:Ca2+/Na+ antiporter